MAGRVILHIDLNSYFASAEILKNTGGAAGRCGGTAQAKCGINGKL